MNKLSLDGDPWEIGLLTAPLPRRCVFVVDPQQERPHTAPYPEGVRVVIHNESTLGEPLEGARVVLPKCL